MNAVCAMRLPLNTDLSHFVALLKAELIPHRVTESGGEQLLWVPDEPTACEVRARYQRFLTEPYEIVQPAKLSAFKWQALKKSPVTVTLLLITFMVAALTGLGDWLDQVAWFSFNHFSVSGAYAYFTPLAETLSDGQWWRLITPIFIHFGLLHLAMNSLWIWELGRRVEARHNGIWLIGLVVLSGLISNVAQYALSGPSIFGGLSGVLYALLGYCWLFSRISPCPEFQLPKGVVVMMLVWLVVCLTGVFDLLGLGSIANAAHVSGLLVGCVIGVLMGLLAKAKAKPV